jgi:hypothetical protein
MAVVRSSGAQALFCQISSLPELFTTTRFPENVHNGFIANEKALFEGRFLWNGICPINAGTC